jgi:hypothetical protein
MARYSRESRLRSVRAGTIGSFHCAICGASFWTEAQKQAHYAQSGGRTYCQHAPAIPELTDGPCWHGDSRSCHCED